MGAAGGRAVTSTERPRFECSCYTHDLVAVAADVGDDPWWAELAMWEQTRNGFRFPWGHRLRHIWRIVRRGEPYTDQVTLDRDQALALAAWLQDEARRGAPVEGER